MYAHDTEVPVDRSQSEIKHLLLRNGCDAIQWTEDTREGFVQVRFRFRVDSADYSFRLRINRPTNEVLAKDYKRPPTMPQLVEARAKRWRALHRVLFLTLKAQFAAVDAGLVSVVEVLVPYLETSDGRVVADALIPKLRDIATGRVVNLLGGPS